MKITHSLGVSFGDNRIQLAEVELGKKPTVTALAEQDSSLDFLADGAALRADHPKVSIVLTEIGNLIQHSGATAQHISYALPAKLLFINTLPVDPTLKDDDLKDYLRWELQQYFPDAGPKDFITDAYTIPSKEKDARRTFMVSVQRGIVAFLQKVTAELKLTLQIVDIDHFSSEKTLSANYPEMEKETVALFGVRMGGVDASVVKNHEMTDYRAYTLDASSSLEKTVARYLSYIKQKDGTQKIAGLYLHGTQVPSEALSSLTSE
ncbi:MAG: type IV pilus biogenesis protein PilM, partial [Bacteroidota bacterium]